MALKTKTTKIGKFEINIIQFNALEAIAIRKKIVSAVKEQMGDISLDDSANILKAIAGLFYEMPPEVFLELFKNCAAADFGALDNKESFNSVFEGNLDGPLELALEVLDFNGFFTPDIISKLSKKVPMLKPVEEMMKKAFDSSKETQ